MDEMGNPLGLVGGQGIHRIDEDHLDTPLSLSVRLAAVVEAGVEEGLGFTRACAGGHQGVLGGARAESLEGLLLVPVGREGQLELREPVGAAALLERKRNRDVGAFDQPIPIGEKAVDQPFEAGGCGVKGGGEGVPGDLLQLGGDDRGEHGAAGRLQELGFRVGSLAGAGRCLGRQEWRHSRLKALASAPQLCDGCSREPPKLSGDASAQQPCLSAMPNLTQSLRIARS